MNLICNLSHELNRNIFNCLDEVNINDLSETCKKFIEIMELFWEEKLKEKHGELEPNITFRTQLITHYKGYCSFFLRSSDYDFDSKQIKTIFGMKNAFDQLFKNEKGKSYLNDTLRKCLQMRPHVENKHLNDKEIQYLLEAGAELSSFKENTHGDTIVTKSVIDVAIQGNCSMKTITMMSEKFKMGVNTIYLMIMSDYPIEEGLINKVEMGAWHHSVLEAALTKKLPEPLLLTIVSKLENIEGKFLEKMIDKNPPETVMNALIDKFTDVTYELQSWVVEEARQKGYSHKVIKALAAKNKDQSSSVSL